VPQEIYLYKTLVMPVLNNGAEIWGYHLALDVESINSKFCRKILSIKRSTNLTALYGELGIVPLNVHRKILMIKYWLKLLTLNENSILFRTYKLFRSDANDGNTYGGGNWASHIQKILEEHGFAYFWTYQDYRLINFNSIKQRILDCYNMAWHNDINKSELKSYCSY